MSAGLARNWWAVGLRAGAAMLFAAALLALPNRSIAAVVLLFAGYVAADGAFAIVAAVRAARHGERWSALILEGLFNFAAAAGVLLWPAITLAPFVRLASVWAVATGALMLAAARRLLARHGRWMLAFAGGTSAAWGVAAAAAATPSPGDDLHAIAWWFAAYALLFGAAHLVLAARLRGRSGRQNPSLAR